MNFTLNHSSKMKNFLFISRYKDSRIHLQSDLLDNFKNNYCNFDFGFFLLSLKCIGNVDYLFLQNSKNKKKSQEAEDQEINNLLEKKYDAIIIDLKTLNHCRKTIFLLLKKINKPNICLYLGLDKILPNYEILIDIVEPKLIYVTNLYKDYNLYRFKNKNLDKLRETFLGLGFLNINYNLNNYSFDNFKSLPKSNDIFFSGNLKGDSSEFRSKCLEYINQNFLDLKKKILINKPLDKENYIINILKTKINIVLMGNLQNLTYRHNEIPFLNSFFLTDSSFKNFKISENYSALDSITFNNDTKLKELIYFYSRSDNERDKLTLRLSMEFKDFYCPKKQGEKIYADLFN
jgi:hypothetical protein